VFTVYVLSLLYIDGYYVGFSSNFPRRLTQHILGEGANVTKEFGVCSIMHTEPAPDVPSAIAREGQLTRLLRQQGAIVWGGSLATTKPRLKNFLHRASRIIDPNAPERSRPRIS